MAKFKTQGSTLLAQHFGALNASALEPLLVAVLTSQLEMPGVNSLMPYDNIAD